MTIDWQYKASKWNKSPHKHNNLRYTSNLLKINIYLWMKESDIWENDESKPPPLRWAMTRWPSLVGRTVPVQFCENMYFAAFWTGLLIYKTNDRGYCVWVRASVPRKALWAVSECWLLSPAAVLERPPATLSTRQGLCVKDRRWWVDTPGQRRMAQRWR